MAETTAKIIKPRKTPAPKARATDGNPEQPALTSSKRAEAKSRFNAALEEARAGAALLGEEAKEKAEGYRVRARTA